MRLTASHYIKLKYILLVVLYGSETWPITLKKERRLRVFENRTMRRIFGLRRDENGEWRSLQNGEFHSLCRSPNIVRVIKYKDRQVM